MTLTLRSYTNWYVGMPVVCIGRPAPYEPPPYPVPKRIYTLSKIWKARDMILVDLVELPAEPVKGYYTGYRATCFRPVVPRAVDISVFTALLSPKIEGAEVRA